jgi:hypothetical protein
LCFVPRLVWNTVVCAVLASALLVAGAQVTAEDSRSAQPDDGVLLLRSGRLVHGRISESSGGFVVELTNGRMLVPFNQVKMQAVTPNEVYYKLRKEAPEGSTTYLLSLATWCLNNKLYNQARNEVQAVLKAEPDNPTARRMMTRIDSLLDTKQDDAAKERPSLYQRLLAPEAKSLAGLSPEVAATFVSRVQPILMNNCALSGCHGPRGRNEFALLRVHLTSGSRRGQSERNLAATLRYVDVDRPEASALLEKPKGKHGRRGRTIFRGRGGARQLEILRNWVRMIARDSQQTADPRESRGVGTPRGRSSIARRPAGEPVVTPQLRAGFGNGTPPTSYQPTPAMRAARSRLKSPTGNRGKKTAKRRPTAGDPFDPDEFNRQTGPAAREPRQSSPTREQNR